MNRIALGAVAAIAVSAWLLVGVAPAAMAATVSGPSGDFSAIADNSNVGAGATITGYTGAGGSVVIPSSVVIAGQTYSVVTIANSAMANDAHITGVTIPGTVTTIGTQAFFQDAITSVIFNEGLRTIGDFAFFDNHVNQVRFPSTLSTLGVGVFDDNGTSEATFLGPAPGGVVGPGGLSPTLGASPLTVNYPWRFGAPEDTSADAYTTPTWLGYNTVPVVTVSFDLNGHGSEINPQQVASGGTVVEPADPVASGLTFTGWYTDATLTSRFDFGDPATADETAFAGWATLATTGVAINPLSVPSAIVVVLLGLLLMLVARRRTS